MHRMVHEISVQASTGNVGVGKYREFTNRMVQEIYEQAGTGNVHTECTYISQGIYARDGTENVHYRLVQEFCV